MSFKTLEQRYKEKVNDLYRGATSKFDNGRPSRGANDDPIIVRRVGDGYFGGVSRALGRFLPVTSAFQDVKRLTLFTASIRGATFLAKQALLQTGNTFQATRLLNPAFTIANAVPFLRVRRHLSGLSLSGLIGKTDTSYENVRKLGQLQQETVDKLAGNPAGFLASISSIVGAKRNAGWSSSSTFGGTTTDSSTWRTTSRPELATSQYQIDKFSTFGSISDTLKFKFGGTPIRIPSFTYQEGRKYITQPGFFSLGVPGDYYKDANTRNVTRKTSSGNPIEPVSNPTDSRSSLIENTTNRQLNQSQIKSLYEGTRYASPSDVNAQREKFIRYRNTNPTAKNKINDVIGQNGRDTSNAVGTSGLRGPYNTLNNNFDDYITVSFAMGNEPPLKFRAFLKDLQQSATPQYKEYQYIGRTEKFISYSAVQREVSFKLGVLALHPDELTQVWKRINYLTGTVFPYTVTRGIYQPNIVRMTIGKVFVNQPMYVTSLTTNFTEILESWDIDQEVPHSAQMDMKCILIEKTQRIASSPFYSIVEGA